MPKAWANRHIRRLEHYELDGKLLQRDYYEHIILDEESYLLISDYHHKSGKMERR